MTGLIPKSTEAGTQRDGCIPTFTPALSHQKVEATQVSADGFRNKQNVVCPYTGILFSLKEEGGSVTCHNTGEH